MAPGERRWLVAGVAGLHLLLLWGLLQVGAVRQTLREVAPLMVSLISLEAPSQPALAPPPRLKHPQPPQPTAPVVVVAATTPQAPPAPAAVVAPEPVPVQAAPAAPVAPTAPAAWPAVNATASLSAPQPAPLSAPAAAPKPVAASALRYAVLPPVELPLASRRLGESGTVLLRVVFDTQGRVKQASVHRSSGFSRLDEQALAAMRQARITPFLDNGIAIEVSAIAPLAYELD
jgi:protein TonB